MRQIEKQMVHALRRGINWHLNNTQVAWNEGIASIYLHGNQIATWVDGEVYVNERTLIDWPTPTTMSRLRALGVSVYRKNWEVYLEGSKL